MATTILGSTTKPIASQQLVELLDEDSGIDGTLYIGYPVFGTPEGAFPFDALLLSPTLGAVAFDVVEGRNASNYMERQDNIFSKLNARLLQYPALVGKRTLLVEITVITFAPAAVLDGDFGDPEYPVYRGIDMLEFLHTIRWKDQDRYKALCSAIQSMSNIRKGRRRRVVKNPDSRGAKLQRLNDSIANLDSHQGAAVVETVQGVQRIRGLAGSGKTIVLALKVAYLHAQNPEWKIAVTFNTRSLKGQFERLINTFVIEQTNEEPDWDQIRIMHSWGSPSTPAGIYYEFTKENQAEYLDLRTARARFGEGKEFGGACDLALQSTKAPVPHFDAILIDEAQDLPPSFLRLCYAMLREPKRLVYAYDELQSLTNASMPPPEVIFGKRPDGQAVVQFQNDAPGRPKQDITLNRCYRNSRPILVTAHGLGFGIYREPGGLIQIFDQHQLWLDVGYKVTEGTLADGQRVRLERTPDSSPLFLENHSRVDDLIKFKKFDSEEEQESWLVSQIVKNIQEDELSPEDIIVINPDPLKTRKAVARARAMLFEKGINSSLAGVTNSPDVFFENDVVTFTGIFRAKGNEAAMVYIINADDCFDALVPAMLTRARNQLFTAITRSKAWVRVLGVGDRMRSLMQENAKINSHDFTLNFVYPDEEQRKVLHVVNRDMTTAARNRVTKNVSDLAEILSAIEDGDMRVEDLPANMRRRLRQLLAK